MLNRTDLARADLNLLVLFDVVLAERHVGRAAERLNISPSAVSHGLGRLRRLLNDPLFLRTPRGVVPTARAAELADPVAEILARARSVIATAAPFDAARSVRRFTIGAPDGVSTVVLPPLLAAVHDAPGIDLSVRQLLPLHGGPPIERAWEPGLADLESRAIDIAIAPLNDAPARFATTTLYKEEFVIATRAGHGFAADPTLDRYCATRHLVVSLTGDTHGFVDNALARQGRERRVALAVPSFLMALAVIAETDLATALPRRFVAMHVARFGVVGTDPPLRLPRFRIRAIAPKVALMDAGVAWLYETMRGLFQAKPGRL